MSLDWLPTIEDLRNEIRRLKAELSGCVSADAARQESAHQDGVICELKAEVVRLLEREMDLTEFIAEYINRGHDMLREEVIDDE